MRTPGLLIIAAVLLAGCAHQQQPWQPAPPQASPPGTGGGSHGNALLATAEEDPAQDQAVEEEPRIIRGNDRLYGTIRPGPGVDGPPVSLKFEEAPLVDVVRSILGDVLKVDYTLHPPISGAITMSTSKEVSPDQAVFLLEIALQANGMAMGRDARGTWHVGSIQAIQAMSPSLRMASPGSKIKLPPGTGPIIVPLHYIGAGEMAAILGAFVPAEAIVRVDSMRNMLILAGNRSQAEGWLDIVATFDVDLLAGMSVGIFPLKYVTAQEVQEALALVTGSAPPSGAGTAPGAGARPGAPAQPASATASTAAAMGGALAASGMGNPLAGAVRIMPLERINSVLVVTPRAAYLDQAREWIEKLDRPSKNNAEPQLFVYPVQNGNAAHLAGLVSSIFGGTGSTSGSTGVAPGLASSSGSTGLGNRGTSGSNTFNNRSTTTSSTGLSSTGTTTGTSGRLSGRNSLGGQNQPGNSFSSFGLGDTVRVIADELNNAILVYSTAAEYEKIETALKRLDIPPVQVLIEASIVEVTLSNNLEYGLQWAFKNWFDNAGYLGTGSLGAGIASSTGGFSYVLAKGESVRAALSMLASESLLKIISSPSLMVLDNHEASINVGNETPVLTGTTINTSGDVVLSNNVQWKPTGVQLSILPSVNAGDMVTLQLSQSVTELGEEDPIVNQRGFLTREIDTKVAVRSGETLVLGGLIRDSSTDGNGGIPFLKDIPVIGKLFGTTTKSGERNELIVIITPRVVRSDEQIRQLSRELSSRVKGLRRIEAKKLPPYMYEFTDEVQQPDSSALPVDFDQEQDPAPAQVPTQ